MSIGNHCIEFLTMIKKTSNNIFSIFSSNDCATSKTYYYTSVNFELANEIVRFKNVLNYDRINVKTSILNDLIQNYLISYNVLLVSK